MSFYNQFSTSTKKRARDFDQRREGTSDGESFYGQFSTSTKRREETSQKNRGQQGFFLMLMVAFILVFGLVRPFIAEPMHVPSDSMAPTLQVGDRVLTNKFIYAFSEPERGDLVVFESIDKKKDEDVVKRVIGLPGDEISVENGVLLVNRKPPYEPYLATGESTDEKRPGMETFGPVFVPKDHVFVMGDNRANSYDSRFFGPVPNENLVGKASLRFWPNDRFGTPS